MIRRGKIRDVKCPYHRGVLANFQEVLGKNPLLWLWPQPMLGDGLYFKVRRDNPSDLRDPSLSEEEDGMSSSSSRSPHSMLWARPYDGSNNPRDDEMATTSKATKDPVTKPKANVKPPPKTTTTTTITTVTTSVKPPAKKRPATKSKMKNTVTTSMAGEAASKKQRKGIPLGLKAEFIKDVLAARQRDPKRSAASVGR
ncbi:Palmitoyltransferase [Gamsiella multidivaricata]|nr:Palmitoyltransferase [Gamsiella multidivaricata]